MRAVLAAMILGACWPACAQVNADLTGCSTKKDDRERLACFDAAMKAEKRVSGEAAASASEDATTSTREIVKTPPAGNSAATVTFKAVDPDDLYVAPGKYEGRPVELPRMRCFHADKNEYRCIAVGSLALVIFAADIQPRGEQEKIESDCGEIKKAMTSPKCLKTIRFVPLKHDQDLVSGYRKRVLVLAKSIEIGAGATAKKR